MVLTFVEICGFMILWLNSVNVHGYLAQVDIEVASFRALDPTRISEGKPCDDRNVDGSWNPCDYVFYIDDCRRDQANSYVFCIQKVNRFYAPQNQDVVYFNATYPPPFTSFMIEGRFPNTLFANITVWDQDDGYSGDDFVGNYKFFITPTMMNRYSGGVFTPWVDHVITIPFHSEMVLRYRATCLDTECQNQPTGPQLFNGNSQINQFVQNRLPQEQLIGQNQFNQGSNLNQWGNGNQWNSGFGSFDSQSFGQSLSGSFNRFPFERRRAEDLENTDSQTKEN